MTETVHRPRPNLPPEVEVVPASPRLRATLLTVAVLAVLAIAVAGGFAWGSHTSPSSTPAAATPGVNSVDAGFARDMSTHHQQAITMATYAHDNSTDTSVANQAFDIESEQSIQLGEMTGWLDTWGLSRTSGTPMSWMGSNMAHMTAMDNGLMPGMATPAQLNELLTLHGKALNILFLQLMIHHHQGGVAMAEYAAAHASEPYVRTLAGQMVASQKGEITQMEQTLAQLGGKPLPPPMM